jgi:phosphatidylserine/phosphatidylglycerophosphate/cardiolipin synthase-like enzyme
MTPDSTQLPEPGDVPGAALRQRRARRARRRWIVRTLLATLGIAWAGIAAWHSGKALPPGLSVASAWLPVDARSLRVLFDVTTADAYGRPVVQQSIFDESLKLVADARQFIVLDYFLLNDLADGTEAPLRALSHELCNALIAAKRARPQLEVLLLTDPVNELYGASRSPLFAQLRTAGIEVVSTALDPLRDSNAIYSGFWRLAIRWWAGAGGGADWLPNPLEPGPARVSFGAWARLLNFKANHRKVLIADDGGGALVGLVGSANPHDASSAHSNIAIEVRGEALRPLLQSETAIARFSGWRDRDTSALQRFSAVQGAITTTTPAGSSRAAAGREAAGRDFDGGRTLYVRVLTEGAIRTALLERIDGARRGERIDAAMFYVADRGIVESLVDAAQRGVEVRLLLDPNKDAFGHQKSGIPNRPAASELVARTDGAIKVRWYRTHGEQFHTKLLSVRGNGRIWFTAGSANLTRRNLGDFNLEANLAVEASESAQVAGEIGRWFDTLWFNRAPAGIEYSADFGTFADPAQTSYWAYRLMEGTGLSPF